MPKKLPAMPSTLSLQYLRRYAEQHGFAGPGVGVRWGEMIYA